MTNPKVLEYLDAIADEMMAMPTEKFRALIDKETEIMRQAVIHGHDHLGLVLWYGKNPEECQKWVDEVKAEHARNGKETT